MGANYIQNSNYVAGKANEFREVAVIRLREIYGRLLSIGVQVARIGPAAAAAAQAVAAGGCMPPQHTTRTRGSGSGGSDEEEAEVEEEG